MKSTTISEPAVIIKLSEAEDLITAFEENKSNIALQDLNKFVKDFTLEPFQEKETENEN